MNNKQQKIKKRYQFNFINKFTGTKSVIEHLFINDSDAVKSIKNNYFNNNLEKAYIFVGDFKKEIKLNV